MKAKGSSESCVISLKVRSILSMTTHYLIGEQLGFGKGETLRYLWCSNNLQM